MNSTYLCLAATALLALLAATPPPAAAEKRAVAPPAAPTAVETTTVRFGPAVREVSAVGTLRANESVTIAAEISGRIEEILFSEGGRVGKGDLLLRLDRAVLLAERDRARASLLLSEADYRRAEALFDQQTISARERDAALSRYRLDEAEVRLKEAELDKASIRAPFAGVLGLRLVSPGGYLEAGDPIATLSDTDPLKLDFAIPESYAGLVRSGGKVAVSVAPLPGRTFEGTIYVVDPQVDDKGRTLRLRARLANRGGELRPGMFASVVLPLGGEQQSLFVPEEAIVTQGGKQLVYRVIGGKAEATPVKTGVRRQGEVEIVAGLAAGETIITAGHHKVRPGGAVTVVPAR